MRPIPADRQGRINRLVFLSVAVASFACDPPTGTGRVRSLALTVPATELRPGFFMRVEASPLDAAGKVVEGTLVRWSTRTPNTLDVSADGLMLALAPGEGIARVTSGSVSQEVHLDLVNPPIAQLTVDVDTLRLPIPGAPRQVVANPKDAIGIGIIGAPLDWESTAPRIARVSPTGLVTPLAVGHTTVRVSGDGITRTVEVFVFAPPTATSPVITNVAPTFITPGLSVVVTGTGFSNKVSGNTVMVDGIQLLVTNATTTQIVLSVPAAASLPCVPTGTVALQVSTIDGIGVSPVTLAVATTRTLAVGQSVILTNAADARCNELTAAPGRYLVTLPNAGRALGAGSIGLTVVGVATFAAPLMANEIGAAAKRNEGAIRSMQRGHRPLDGAQWVRGRRDRRRDAAHLQLLEAERAIAPAPGSLALTAPSGGASMIVPAPGAILPVRVPAVDQQNPCIAYTPINARVVTVSDHFVFLEDTSSVIGGQATLARQMDADYGPIASELEARGWPIASAFGNPLVMDSRLDDNGRVMVVFTPRMNQLAGGALLAATVNCDFYPRAVFVASNIGEYVYAQVPTTLASGMAYGTRARWRHEMRATLVHELKHVVSFAERTVRFQLIDEPWLEEATARQAEELYGRAAYGTTRFGNTTFAAQLACEVRANDPAVPSCADAPRAIFPHFEGLWGFLDAPTDLTPFGPTAAGDFTFFGSGWALTRWLADQDAPSESVFFTALTTSGQSGVTNLEARSGRGWDEILPEWSLAMAAAGRGITPTSPLLRFPSWDLRSNYLGLCEVVGSCIVPQESPFVRAYPLQPVQLDGGAFSAAFDAVSPGGFIALEIVASPAIARQLIELRGLNGATLPSAVRMGILRIQ